VAEAAAKFKVEGEKFDLRGVWQWGTAANWNSVLWLVSELVEEEELRALQAHPS
jgi:hypothetical protein